MSGGKGGSQTSSVQIPEYIEAAAQRNLNKAERISQLGYVPYYGPDVAALSPMQQAAMQNTAGAASAFGMATPTGQDIYGMPAPTEYAGGIQGYSSAPVAQQSVDQLAAQRPAQKSYIDSFFIDPTSGQYAYQPMDYTQYATAAETGRQQAQADRDSALAIAQAQAAAGPTTTIQNTTLTPVELQQYASTVGGANYNPSTDLRSTVDASGTYSVPDTTTEQRVAAEDLAMGVLGNANNNIVDDARGLFNSEPSFDNPSSSGSYGGSLVTGGLSGDFTPVPGVYGNIADNVVGNVAPGYAMDQQGRDFAATMGSTRNPDGTYDISSWYGDSGPVTQPSGGGDGGGGSTGGGGGGLGGYSSIGDMFDGGGPGRSGDTYQGGGAISDIGNAVTGSGGGGGGGSSKILCCAYYNLGYLPREIWRLDQRYGVWLHRHDPELMRGYHVWAAPLAEFVQNDTPAAKAVRAVMWPIVKAWAEEMAHKQRPEKHKANMLGKVITVCGEAFSRMCGKLKPRTIEKVA